MTKILSGATRQQANDPAAGTGMKLKRPIHRRLRAQRTSGAAFNGPKHLLLLLTDPPAAVHRASDCDVSPPVLHSGGNSGKKNRRLQFFSANESSAGHDSTLEPIQFFYRKRIFFRIRTTTSADKASVTPIVSSFE